MIEMEIPKDIRKYEAKLIGPLTTRQTICAVLGSALCIPTYFIFDFIPQDIRFVIIAVIGLPFILVGWIKPYGMPFELFAKQMWFSTIASPQVRKYETQNAYSTKTKKSDMAEEAMRKKKYKNRKNSKEFMPYE